MVNVLQHFMEQNDEDAVAVGIEVFDDLVAIEAPILSKHMSDLVQFFLSIGANKNLSESIRVNALTFLMFAAI